MHFYSIYCGIAKLNDLTSRYQKLGICKPRTWRLRSQCETEERRQWRERNHTAIKRLAEMVGAGSADIDDFLYDLTLKKYSLLLNPKECGWSLCKVPLCYPIVCDRYMGIFDRHGDLMDPTHPKSLHHLLQLLQDFLNGASHESCHGLPIYAEYPGGRRRHRHKFRRPLFPHEDEMDGADEHFRNSFLIWDPGNKITEEVEKIATPELEEVGSPNNSPRMSPVDGQSKSSNKGSTKNTKKTFGRYSVFLNDELALSHGHSYHYMERLVDAALERRRSRSSYVGPIGNLRAERMHTLVRQIIERKGSLGNQEDLDKPKRKVSFGYHVGIKRQKEVAYEISRLYGSIVQSDSNNSIKNYLTRPKPNPPTTFKRRNLPIVIPIRYYEPIEDKSKLLQSTVVKGNATLRPEKQIK